MVAASVLIMKSPIATSTYQAHTHPMQSHIKLGIGSDIAIVELVQVVGQSVWCRGNICFDVATFDGAPRKLMDCTLLVDFERRPQVAMS